MGIKDNTMGTVSVSFALGEGVYIEEFAEFSLRDLENKGIYQAVVEAADQAREKILRKFDDSADA